MESLVTWLSSPPGALPAVLPSPFDDVEPCPPAQDAARTLMATLATGHIAPGFSTALLHGRPEGGKMFGVLLVRASDGRVGVLRAFSGQLGGAWRVPGYVPPLFDAAARTEVEPASDVAVKSLTAKLEALAAAPEARRARAALTALEAQQRARRAELKARLQARRTARHERRAASLDDLPALRALDEESKQDDLERRRLEGAWRDERAVLEAPVVALEVQLDALEAERRAISQEAMRRIHDTYTLRNARGEQTTLRALFSPGEPPWGAGDCAAPKLVGHALAHHLTPLALAEFWWGPPPPGGGRVEGTFFPACREKCGPVLPFLLGGVDVAARRTVRPREVGDGELEVLHEDARVVVVAKPSGLLSVPARDEAVTDSVWARLTKRYPSARGPLVVHRLDLDTSGVLVAALDDEAHRLLQAQFSAREVHKEYVAWLEGEVTGERGTVELPLRLDADQRPRQVVDFVHGKPATSDWEVLERRERRTRVRFTPRSGRTHQLRVHAAHALGLGAPIVGDRLYGRPGERLMLHAERITFRHPATGASLTVTCPAPF